jgi:hypothetical protein
MLHSTGSLKFRKWEIDWANGEIVFQSISHLARRDSMRVRSWGLTRNWEGTEIARRADGWKIGIIDTRCIVRAVMIPTTRENKEAHRDDLFAVRKLPACVVSVWGYSLAQSGSA